MAETTSQAPDAKEAGDNTSAPAAQASKTSKPKSKKEDPRGVPTTMHGVKLFVKG